MKYTIKLLTALIVAIAGLARAQNGKEPNAAKAPVTAFVNVNVIPMDRERVIENQTVMVRGRWLPETEIQGRLGELAASLRAQ